MGYRLILVEMNVGGRRADLGCNRFARYCRIKVPFEPPRRVLLWPSPTRLRCTAFRHVRLPGEGSTPVPLPRPASLCCRASKIAWVKWADFRRLARPTARDTDRESELAQTFTTALGIFSEWHFASTVLRTALNHASRCKNRK